MSALSSNSLSVLQAQNAIDAGKGLPHLAANSGKHVGKLDMRKARETAQNFEGVFLAEMLKPMFEDIEAAPPFGGGTGSKIWRDLQTQEYGKAIAKAGGIGIADAVLHQMIKMQESK